MVPSRRHQPASDELHNYSALESPSSIENPDARTFSTRRRDQNIQKVDKQKKSNSSEQDVREQQVNSAPGGEGTTTTSPNHFQVTTVNGTQLEKSSNVKKKKKKTRKQKDAEHLQQEANESEMLDEDYTMPLNDGKDRSQRVSSVEQGRKGASRYTMVAGADRSKSRKRIEDTSGASRTPCTPHSTKKSYFELDLAHGSTPMSLISMEEFDWLEDLYYEDSHAHGTPSDSAWQSREPDNCEVISTTLDYAEKIMDDNDYPEYKAASTQMKRSVATTTNTMDAKTELPFASEEQSDGEHNNVMSAAVFHIEQITKKSSCISPQIKRTFLQKHTSLVSQKKSNSSEGESNLTTSKDDGHGKGKKQVVGFDENSKHSDSTFTESYLESPEWKAREKLRKDWIDFIANHRSRQSRLKNHRSSSVPNMIAATSIVTPNLLGAKSTSLHATPVTRSAIRRLSSSSPAPASASASAPTSAPTTAPTSAPASSPQNDESLVLSLESWEVEQRKAVLERKIKNVKRNDSSATRHRRTCTNKVQKA